MGGCARAALGLSTALLAACEPWHVRTPAGALPPPVLGEPLGTGAVELGAGTSLLSGIDSLQASEGGCCAVADAPSGTNFAGMGYGSWDFGLGARLSLPIEFQYEGGETANQRSLQTRMGLRARIPAAGGRFSLVVGAGAGLGRGRSLLGEVGSVDVELGASTRSDHPGGFHALVRVSVSNPHDGWDEFASGTWLYWQSRIGVAAQVADTTWIPLGLWCSIGRSPYRDAWRAWYVGVDIAVLGRGRLPSAL